MTLSHPAVMTVAPPDEICADPAIPGTAMAQVLVSQLREFAWLQQQAGAEKLRLALYNKFSPKLRATIRMTKIEKEVK